MPDIAELPEGLTGGFEVIDQSGTVGQKTWRLRHVETGVEYRLTPATIKGRSMRHRADSIGPSIIVSMEGRSMVAMHLATGEFYTTGSPPTAVR